LKIFIKWTVIGVVFIAVLSFLFGKQEQSQTMEEITTQADNPQVEEKQKSQQEIEVEEERLDSQATQYCSQRKQSNRYYPLPVARINEDGQTEYELEDSMKKTGSSLTQTDCRNVIDYLTWFTNKFGQVAHIETQNVIERKYWIGMNVVELMSSLGWPNDVNTTDYGVGKTEQWIYYKDSSRITALYIYLEDSTVTSYQDI